MVKIKVRSIEDIASAYLQHLGLKNNKDVDKFLKSYPELKHSETPITDMDNLLYKLCNKFIGSKLNKLQTVSLFKNILIEENLLEKYGIEILCGNNKKHLLNSLTFNDYEAELKNSAFETAPKYKFSEMPVQEISTVELRKKDKK